MDQQILDRFGGIARLYGLDALGKFQKSHVLVIGLGGVGSWTVESLARSGVGQLTLVDFDDICVSNTNRQLHAMSGQVGKMKTQVLKERCEKINPDIQIKLIEEPYEPATEELIFDGNYDFVVDAIDRAETKEHLALACIKRKLKFVMVGSAGGRRDPSQLKVNDLSLTREDPMLKIIRKSLRRDHDFPRKGKMGILTVSSTEKPFFPVGENEFVRNKPENFHKPLDCATGFGTATSITGTFGFMAASAALEQLKQQTSS